MNFRKFLFFMTISFFLFFCGCSIDGNADYLSPALPEKTREETLRSALSQLEGIEDVKVSIWGRTALVGYEPKEDADAEISDIIRIKALETDRDIQYVSVSRNPEIMKRIGNLKP